MLIQAGRYVGRAISAHPPAIQPSRIRKLLLVRIVECIQDKHAHVRKPAADLLRQIIAADSTDTVAALRTLLKRRLQPTVRAYRFAACNGRNAQ